MQILFILFIELSIYQILNSIFSYYFTLSALGVAGPSIIGGLPGAYWAIILLILIIILFKERINDYLEKKLGQYLENWPKY